jgi:bacterial/archaeal transporter family protein
LSWIGFALGYAVLIAISNIFDKTVQYRYTRTPLTLPLLIGIAHTLIGVVVMLIAGVPAGVPMSATFLIFISGTLLGLGGLFMVLALYRTEVSRVVSITQTSPIFAAIFAVLFLGESLTALQWAAVVATVVGAIMISAKVGSGFGFTLERYFFLLMFAATITAAGNVIGKAALDDLPVLYAHGVRSFGLGTLFLLASTRGESLRSVATLVRQRSPGLLVFGFSELFLANVGLLFLLMALSLGPASLVLAVVGTRTMFVVVISTALALLWKGALGERTTRQAITIKAGSAALIVASLAVIST